VGASNQISVFPFLYMDPILYFHIH